MKIYKGNGLFCLFACYILSFSDVEGYTVRNIHLRGTNCRMSVAQNGDSLSVLQQVISTRVEVLSKQVASLTGQVKVLKLPSTVVPFDQVSQWVRTPGTPSLEVDPWFDTSKAPQNTYRPKDPYIGTVVSVTQLTGPKATGEVHQVTVSMEGKMPYWEGQSLSVIPPGTDPKSGKPHRSRLYSIASTRYGDDGTGKTVSFCIRRARFLDPLNGIDDPTKAGVASNFLCSAKPGDKVMLAGPSGKILLMPESESYNTDIIMVGTGTGVAPYRSFIKRLFVENTPAAAAYRGEAWLFLGVANTDALLYDEDWKKIVSQYPSNFRYNFALSREQKNKKGGKLYIQDKMEEYADEIFNKLENGAHIYFCGLKGMMDGIIPMLERVATSKGMVWKEMLSNLKKKGQWHVEVY
eukprot:67980_1